MSRIIPMAAALLVATVPVESSAETQQRPQIQNQEKQSIQRIEINTLIKNKLRQKAEIAIRATIKPDFTLFRLDNPMRLVIDVPGMDISNALVPTHEDEAGIVKRITTTQFHGKNGTVGRVVIVLHEDTEFNAEVHDKAIVVTVETNAPGKKGGGEENEERSTSMSVQEPVAPGVTPVVNLVDDSENVKPAKRLLRIKAKANSQGSIVSLETDGQIQRYEIEEVEDPP